MSNDIELYAKNLHSGGKSCDMNSSCVHLVQAPIPREMFDNLKAMAAMYDKDARCVAGDVLNLALKELFASLPDGKLQEIEASRKAYDKKAAQKHMDEQFFNAGGS